LSPRKNRKKNEPRPVAIEPGIMENAYASVLIKFGRTKVLCTASMEERVPPYAEASEIGWVTAEYSMLPGSTPGRKRRSLYKPDSRGIEIQRLIGRSLRAAVDLKLMPGITLTIDCDVIQADGGTRTASITGGWCVLAMAAKRLVAEGLVEKSPLIHQIASISAGKVGGSILLDLDYPEDSSAEADCNVVMNECGNFIEVQGTGENGDISMDELVEILEFCKKGIGTLFKRQKEVLESYSA
jgi:ribonuclease PH